MQPTMPRPPAFANEDEFRTEFLVPLFHHLGFLQVEHTHGPEEQGKDFLIADQDRFGNIRYLAVQAKNGKLSVSRSAMDDLLSQVRRAFRIRIMNRSVGDERRVSAVYVMVSGTISDRAREYIANYCRSEPFGENVHFLSGEQLRYLREHGGDPNARQIDSTLFAIERDAEFNLEVATQLRHDGNVSESSRLVTRTSGLEAYLSSPDLDLPVDYSVVQMAWWAAAEFNQWSASRIQHALATGEWSNRLHADFERILSMLFASSSGIMHATKSARQILARQRRIEVTVTSGSRE